MKITGLGHSCVLLDLPSPEGSPEGSPGVGSTRILVDPWLSDHATGDGMGRFPRLRFAVEALGPVHAVFISHAHSDHLDPYTLVRLWRELPEPPALLLPVSLSFLLPVLRRYLPSLDVVVLAPYVPVPFRGLELLGVYDVGQEPTNEDDVMVLVVSNGPEVVLVEADARLSLEQPEFRAYISQLLRGPHIRSAVFLTTENELDATMAARTCRTPAERQALREEGLNQLLEAVHELYSPWEDPDDLWHGTQVLRLVHGQGLAAPAELDPRWQHVLFPVRIDDRVEEERAAAQRAGFVHGIDRLTDGQVHRIVAGRVASREPVVGLTLLDDEERRVFRAELDFAPELPCAPLYDDPRDVEAQRARIQALLDERFLPYLHGLRAPPVLHLLAAYDGAYRIRVHYGSGDAFDYVLGFDARGFVEQLATEAEPQEAYWANDLEDFLDGRCDEFSPFCRTQLPAEAMQLWSCLAMPLLHSDLVARRVALHFERAEAGLTPGSFVMPRYEA